MINILNIIEFPDNQELKKTFLEYLMVFPEIKDKNLYELLRNRQNILALSDEIQIIRERNPNTKDPTEIEATDEFTEAPEGLVFIGGYLMAKMRIPGKIEIEGYNEDSNYTEYFTAVARDNKFSIYLPCTDPYSYEITDKGINIFKKDPFGYIRCPNCNAVIDNPDTVIVVQKDTKTYKIAGEKPISHCATEREVFCVRCHSYIGKEDEIIQYFKKLIDKKAFNVDFLK